MLTFFYEIMYQESKVIEYSIKSTNFNSNLFKINILICSRLF